MAAIKRARTYSTSRAGPYKRTRTSPGSSAKNPIVIPDAQVRRIMNTRISGLMGVEVKFFDNYRVGSPLTAPTSCTGGEHDPNVLNIGCLNAVPPGDGGNQRDGRVFRMKNITVKGQVRLGAQVGQTGPDNLPRVFIALVLDKQTNGTQMNSEDCFVNPSATAVLAADPLLNLENSQRFRVLKTMHIGPKDFAGSQAMGDYPAGSIAERGVTVPFTLFADLKNLAVNSVPSGGGSVGSVSDNSLHIIAFTNDVSSQPVLDYNSRLRFVG